MKILILVAALGTGLLAAGAASAGDMANPPANTAAMAVKPEKAAAMTAKPDKAALEARSQECSKEADAQGLKGHYRKVFREKCKRGAN